jgi:UDP-glucose 4-epimerase
VETPSRFEDDRRRVLLTGGSGSLGRHVLAILVKEGWNVSVVSHRSAVPVPPGPGQVRFVQGRLDQPDSLREDLSEVEVVCHLAAYLPSNYEDSAEARACFEVNCLNTLHLAELCAQMGNRLVFCSSAQAYIDSNIPVGEDAGLYPAERAPYYLTSKLAAEILVENLRRRHGLEAVTFRLGSCYGPGMPARSVVSLFMQRALAGAPLIVRDGGSSRCDFVYVGDVAQLIVQAIKGGRSGVYNAGSGVATSVLELAQAVDAALADHGVRIDVEPPSRLPHSSFPALDMAKTKREWGHAPTSLRDGLAAFRSFLEEEARCA